MSYVFHALYLLFHWDASRFQENLESKHDCAIKVNFKHLSSTEDMMLVYGESVEMILFVQDRTKFRPHGVYKV